MIRPVNSSDSAELVDIYNHYIANTLITFEEELLTSHQFEDRIKIITAKYPFLVFELDKKIVGFAYGNKWRERSAYRFALESSVYVHPKFFGQKIGVKLYEQLFIELKKIGCREIIGVITLPNEISVNMHEKMGFVKAAHFKKVGFKFDTWCDVGFWQKSI